MEPISFSAKTLDDAITKACIELGVTSEAIDYTVVDAGSKGLLGIGARPYVISVSVKQAEKAMKEDMNMKCWPAIIVSMALLSPAWKKFHAL